MFFSDLLNFQKYFLELKSVEIDGVESIWVKNASFCLQLYEYVFLR